MVAADLGARHFSAGPFLYFAISTTIVERRNDATILRLRPSRERAYQFALQQYSRRFGPGATRDQVEYYFRVNNIPFTTMSGIDTKDAPSWTDLVEIGREEHPWYCSQNTVYVAFQFRGSVLRQTSVYRQLGGCL